MEDTKCSSEKNCRDEFLAVFPSLVQDLINQPEMQDMEETNIWLEKVLNYNIPNGRLLSGLTVAISYRALCTNNASDENLRLSYILGWCSEFMVRAMQMSDDIMDENEKSFGKACWYKTGSLTAAIAYNDVILVEAAAFALLKIHFKGKSFYKDLVNCLREALQKTSFGNSLDRELSFLFNSKSRSFTTKNYELLAKYQTTSLHIYTPIKLGMILAEVECPAIFDDLDKIALELGHYLRVQQDFLNCFGKHEFLESGSPDIRNKRCTWLFLSAINKMDVEQQKKFKDLYSGNHENKMNEVKELYDKLDLQETYRIYRETTKMSISSHIQTLSDKLSKGVLLDLLDQCNYIIGN